MYAGQRYVQARDSYNLGQWAEHFSSIDEARAWKKSIVVVHLLSDYQAMIPVLRSAVEFMWRLNPTIAAHEIEITVDSTTRMQGETLEVVVLAFPICVADWSSWMRSPSRLLTTFSRHYRQLILPDLQYVDRGNDPLVAALTTLQRSAYATWTWSKISSALELEFRGPQAAWIH